MTSKIENQSYGPPPPITKLTMEQDLKLRVLHDRLKENYHDLEEEVSTLLLALQHQNFVMGNSITNLVKSWPPPNELDNEKDIYLRASQGVPEKVRRKEQR